MWILHTYTKWISNFHLWHTVALFDKRVNVSRSTWIIYSMMFFYELLVIWAYWWLIGWHGGARERAPAYEDNSWSKSKRCYFKGWLRFMGPLKGETFFLSPMNDIIIWGIFRRDSQPRGRVWGFEVVLRRWQADSDSARGRAQWRSRWNRYHTWKSRDWCQRGINQKSKVSRVDCEKIKKARRAISTQFDHCGFVHLCWRPKSILEQTQSNHLLMSNFLVWSTFFSLKEFVFENRDMHLDVEQRCW